MKHLMTTVLPVLALLLCCAGSSLRAQSTQTALARANQQYVLYENARSDNNPEMYSHLYQSYTIYSSLLDSRTDPEAVEAARTRLTQIYPALKNAAMLYSNMGDTQMTYKFGMAYVLLPKKLVTPDKIDDAAMEIPSFQVYCQLFVPERVTFFSEAASGSMISRSVI